MRKPLGRTPMRPEEVVEERILAALGCPDPLVSPKLREKLIKIGAKVVHHARQVIFQMAEVAIPRELFRAILERIGRLRLLTPVPG
jgi:hypothetical protein